VHRTKRGLSPSTLHRKQASASRFGRADPARDVSISRLAWVSSVTFLFTIPHSIEDFSYGIAQRFGFDVLTAAVGLGVVLASQVWATAALGWRPTLARGLLLAIGLVWVIGALADHIPDLLSASWRSGAPSKGLVVGIIVSQALTVAIAGAELRKIRSPMT